MEAQDEVKKNKSEMGAEREGSVRLCGDEADVGRYFMHSIHILGRPSQW